MKRFSDVEVFPLPRETDGGKQVEDIKSHGAAWDPERKGFYVEMRASETDKKYLTDNYGEYGRVSNRETRDNARLELRKQLVVSAGLASEKDVKKATLDSLKLPERKHMERFPPMADRAYYATPDHSKDKVNLNLDAAGIPREFDKSRGMYFIQKSDLAKVPADIQAAFEEKAVLDYGKAVAKDRGIESKVRGAAELEDLLHSMERVKELDVNPANPRSVEGALKLVSNTDYFPNDKLQRQEEFLVGLVKDHQSYVRLQENLGKPVPAEAQQRADKRLAALEVVTYELGNRGIARHPDNPVKLASDRAVEAAAPAQAINAELDPTGT